MVLPIQLSFLEDEGPKEEQANQLNKEDLGTFKDSLRAPVHRWFYVSSGFLF